MARLALLTAAQLAQASYDPELQRDFARRIKHRHEGEHDVEAYLLHSNTLVIPGSDSVKDYLSFNLRVLNIGGKRYKVKNLDTEIYRNMVWHQGFLAHAKAIQDWLADLDERPVFIVGHSLGAASAQILSLIYNVPAIAFAAPRPRKQRRAPRQIGKCLNINRDDDPVCRLPGSFFHLGQVHLCKTRPATLGPRHGMKHYRAIVTEQQSKGLLPKHWPA